MGRYIIRYEKFGCIGAAVCEVLDPKNWEMNEAKTKANLIDGVLDKERGVWEKEIDEDGLEKAMMAADACPVRVIQIYDKETGKRLI